MPGGRCRERSRPQPTASVARSSSSGVRTDIPAARDGAGFPPRTVPRTKPEAPPRRLPLPPARNRNRLVVPGRSRLAVAGSTPPAAPGRHSWPAAHRPRNPARRKRSSDPETPAGRSRPPLPPPVLPASRRSGHARPARTPAGATTSRHAPRSIPPRGRSHCLPGRATAARPRRRPVPLSDQSRPSPSLPLPAMSRSTLPAPRQDGARPPGRALRPRGPPPDPRRRTPRPRSAGSPRPTTGR